jgi:hypothetical protein
VRFTAPSTATLEEPSSSRDLERTLAAIAFRGWLCVLLPPRSKKPNRRPWPITGEPSVVRAHFLDHGNAGLVCGPDSDTIAIDIDQLEPAREMVAQHGRLKPWVRSGSGKGHAYFKWQAGLPARVMWRGVKVGEIQRGPVALDEVSLQHVVLPPSVHPDGGSYKWLVDPVAEPLLSLPSTYIELWATTPERRARAADAPGVDLEEAVVLALAQPGASKRRDSIKFQCPRCREEGHDVSKDNAVIFLSGEHAGRWGCAFAPKNKRHLAAIARALTGRDSFVTTQQHRRWA